MLLPVVIVTGVLGYYLAQLNDMIQLCYYLCVIVTGVLGYYLAQLNDMIQLCYYLL